MGFLHYDEHPEHPLPINVIDFLAAGEKPILITYSTAITQASSFFEHAIAAIRALGLRCIVLTPHQGNIAIKLRSPSELYVPYVPHKKLMPHCAAIIHSGAMGTAVLALSFKLPQLLVPFFYDQFDNSYRLEQMGVAMTIAFKKWTAKRAGAALQQLLYSNDISMRCEEFAQKIDFYQVEKEICDHIERFLG
jgi:UDP:flavonoid glycosyltransferase YjiC (YdhE family)